jgi:hypothetical protein
MPFLRTAVFTAAVVTGATAMFPSSSTALGPLDYGFCDPFEYHNIEGWMYRTEYYVDMETHIIAWYGPMEPEYYTHRWMDCSTGDWLW